MQLCSGNSFTHYVQRVDLSTLHCRFAREESFRRLKARQLAQLAEEVRHYGRTLILGAVCIHAAPILAHSRSSRSLPRLATPAVQGAIDILCLDLRDTDAFEQCHLGPGEW